MQEPKADGTTAENGWVRIYKANVDSQGAISDDPTNKSNFAWNSGNSGPADDAPVNNNTNTGLGWIDLAGLKVNNCNGSVGCSTRGMCPGINFGDPGALSCTVEELCSGTSETKTVACDGRKWTCSNGCETQSNTVFDKTWEQGECGTFNGGSICGQEAKADSWCKQGTKGNEIPGSVTETWTCGADACGSSGKQVTCSAKTRCGWIETNP